MYSHNMRQQLYPESQFDLQQFNNSNSNSNSNQSDSNKKQRTIHNRPSESSSGEQQQQKQQKQKPYKKKTKCSGSTDHHQREQQEQQQEQQQQHNDYKRKRLHPENQLNPQQICNNSKSNQSDSSSNQQQPLIIQIPSDSSSEGAQQNNYTSQPPYPKNQFNPQQYRNNLNSNLDSNSNSTHQSDSFSNQQQLTIHRPSDSSSGGKQQQQQTPSQQQQPPLQQQQPSSQQQQQLPSNNNNPNQQPLEHQLPLPNLQQITINHHLPNSQKENQQNQQQHRYDPPYYNSSQMPNQGTLFNPWCTNNSFYPPSSSNAITNNTNNTPPAPMTIPIIVSYNNQRIRKVVEEDSIVTVGGFCRLLIESKGSWILNVCQDASRTAATTAQSPNYQARVQKARAAAGFVSPEVNVVNRSNVMIHYGDGYSTRVQLQQQQQLSNPSRIANPSSSFISVSLCSVEAEESFIEMFPSDILWKQVRQLQQTQQQTSTGTPFTSNTTTTTPQLVLKTHPNDSWYNPNDDGDDDIDKCIDDDGGGDVHKHKGEKSHELEMEVNGNGIFSYFGALRRRRPIGHRQQQERKVGKTTTTTNCTTSQVNECRKDDGKQQNNTTNDVFTKVMGENTNATETLKQGIDSSSNQKNIERQKCASGTSRSTQKCVGEDDVITLITNDSMCSTEASTENVDGSNRDMKKHVIRVDMKKGKTKDKGTEESNVAKSNEVFLTDGNENSAKGDNRKFHFTKKFMIPTREKDGRTAKGGEIMKACPDTKYFDMNGCDITMQKKQKISRVLDNAKKEIELVEKMKKKKENGDGNAIHSLSSQMKTNKEIEERKLRHIQQELIHKVGKLESSIISSKKKGIAPTEVPKVNDITIHEGNPTTIAPECTMTDMIKDEKRVAISQKSINKKVDPKITQHTHKPQERNLLEDNMKELEKMKHKYSIIDGKKTVWVEPSMTEHEKGEAREKQKLYYKLKKKIKGKERQVFTL